MVEGKEEKKVCRGICRSASQGEEWTRFVCACVCGNKFFSVLRLC